MVEARRPQRGRVRVSSKNRATIPVEALRKAGLKPGDELIVTVLGDGRLELERPPTRPLRHDIEELIAKHAGKGPNYPPGYLDELRNEWR